MQPFSLEQIIGSAATGGWDWFNAVPEHVRRALETAQAKDAEDGRTIAAAWARFYESPDGRRALEALFDSTLRRTTFFVNLGLDPMSMATFGAFREGQNALAHEIARQIGLGMAEPVKPRET